MEQPNSGADPELEKRIEDIRKFNRTYMARIGVLSEKIFGAGFSLAEIRILNELVFRKSTTASELCRDLSMDGGYLSRILNGFESNGYITKERSKQDARQRKILLTKKGKFEADNVLVEAKKRVMEMLAGVTPEDQLELVNAMKVIDRILNRGEKNQAAKECILRPHRTGDMGLIIHSHAVQFAKDYGFNHEFEALVAEKTGEFMRNFDPARERCWVADHDGRVAGSIFVVKKDDVEVGELRLLFVEPQLRGTGVGRSLLNEAIRFSEHAGYKKLVMWTESVFEHAAELLKSVGMKLVSETPRQRFGKDLVGQQWEMDLSAPEASAAP